MVPFGRNPKSALSEQRSSEQQMGGVQQDECRPRGAGVCLWSVGLSHVAIVVLVAAAVVEGAAD